MLRQLTAAPRSRAELVTALAKRDIPDSVAQRILDRFVDVGLIDDAEYAAMIVRTRHTERGLARRGIAVELRRRGIDDAVAQQVLDQVDPDADEAAARALVRKRLRAMSGLGRETKRRRLAAMLARKGHSGSMSLRVIDEALAGADELSGG